MFEILRKSVSIGETILNHSTGEEIKINLENIKDIVFGIIGLTPKNDAFVYGFFNRDPIKNILVHRGGESAALAINMEALGENIAYSNQLGLYKIINNRGSKKDLNSKGVGLFPYIISREYEAAENMNIFSGAPTMDPFYNEDYKKLIKYTFGLEYETTKGYIPQEKCFEFGLIPVRDGSISGIEYATIVLDRSDGLEKIRKHFELLKEYTEFNKECSYHIHLGGFPLDPRSVFALYNVWSIINDELSEYLPKYAFKTSSFKASRKDYCRPNPRIFKKFEDLYYYLSSGYQAYAGSLTEKHPQDPDKKAKWNIRERYWAQSLIGMCFYRGPKTVEYRMLAPTYNVHKMIFWIYFFNAIMLYAEKMAELFHRSESPLLSIYKETKSIEHILRTIYPGPLVQKMLKTMEELKYIVKSQELAGDYIGENISLEDSVIKRSILE